jgi:tetratricopeptide (TPR) repeat protein
MKRFAWIGVVVCLQLACNKSPQAYVERGNGLAAAGKYTEAELQYRNSLSKDPKFAEAHYRLGLVEYKLRQGTDALDHLQQAVSLDPSNDVYGIELANVSIQAYQAMPNRKHLYERVSQEADLLLKKDPNSFDGLRLKGDVLVIDRKYDEALSELRKANSIRPNDPDVILAMAQTLFAQSRDREGEELVQQFLAARKDFPKVYDFLEAHYVRNKQVEDEERLLQSEIAALPEDAHPRLELAGLYRTSGRNKEMSQVLEQIVTDHTNFPAGPILVGDFYAGFGKWDDALAQYSAGIKQANDKVLYHGRIARALRAVGKREAAIVELNEILKTNPKDPDVRLARAELLRLSSDAKDRDKAITELKDLAVQFPQNAVVHFNLGASYWTKGDSATALKEIQKSASLQKDYLPPRLLLAQMAQAAHNYSAALQAAGQVLALDPNNLDARLLRGAALVGSKQYQQAESDLTALSKLRPDSKEVELELAALAGGEKDYAKAEALYRKLYQPGSRDLRPLQGLLELCVLQHHPEKAQALLDGELKKDPDSRPVHMLLASVATQERKFDIATAQYRWLQSKDPKSAQAYSSMGGLYLLQGDTRDALANYQKAEELAPGDTKILNAIAILESQNGQAKQAIATLNKQLALDPNNASAMNNLAFNLAETGTDLDRALTLAEGVARKFPNDPGVIDTLGWVYTKRGLNQSAIQVLRVLVKKNPNEPAFRYHLGVALLQDKQTADAKRELLAALAQHPPKVLSSKIEENLTQVR